MSQFTDLSRGVAIRQLVTRNGRPILRGDRSQWCPFEPIIWEVGDLGSGVFITVPVWDFTVYSDNRRKLWRTIEGAFASDLGSIPVIARGLPSFSPDGAGVAGYLIHDLLYLTKGLGGVYSRADADRILYDCLKALGVGEVEARAVYAAVRAFGGGGWGS